MELNTASRAKLKNVHPDLVRVVERAAKVTKCDFIITCGPRSIAEQRVLVKKGASKTMKSRHIPAVNGFSHAVDLAATINGKLRWDWPLYHQLAQAMFDAAKTENVTIEWGGNWKPVYTATLSKSFADGPHFQLPWSIYPGK